jgi:hypothetical protein
VGRDGRRRGRTLRATSQCRPHCDRFGIPQGSVLGPLLFLIYVNDIGNSVPDAKVKPFADDTNLYVSHKYIDTLSDKVNCDIGLLCQWFVANELSLNVSENTRNQGTKRITVENMELSKVSACKNIYLGVTLD